MVRAQTYHQPAPRISWRSLAGLFEEAWQRERLRRRGWLIALAALVAAGIFTIALTGGEGNGPAKPGPSIASTSKQDSVSASNGALPALVHLTFLPQALNTPITVGVTKAFKVQLVDHLDQPVDRSGVRVYLTRSTYMGKGRPRLSAIVNGKPVGQRIVLALTNARGIATFRITGTKASVLPTQFNAFLVDKAAGFQYGVTGTLAVWFRAPKH
jgi:hypothetical protein